MPSLINEHTQFIDPSTGLPAVGGSLYIGSQNQDPVANPITIYSDRGLTTTLANPQTLDASGRATNKIWVPGKYSLQVNDLSGSQVYQELDNGELAQTGISQLDNVQGTDTITAEGSPAILTLVDKQAFVFTAANANTGAVTLKIDTTAAKSIKKAHNQNLESGDIDQDQIVMVVYNADDDTFELVSHANTGAFESITDQYGDLRASSGFIYGLNTAPDTDSEHDIAIAVGSCADSANAVYMNLSTVLTKRIDANWSAGDNNGGFPSGLSLSADTWYHFFLIAHSDGTVDAGWDTSLTATNLLSDATGYIYYRRIASHLTDGSSNIISYIQNGADFVWSVPVNDVADATPSGANTVAMTTPTGLELRGRFAVAAQYASATMLALLTALDQADTTPTISLMTVQVSSGSVRSANTVEIYTNTSSQIRYRGDTNGGTLYISTLGWTDPRTA